RSEAYLLQPRAGAAGTLRPPAAEGGDRRVAADRQVAAAAGLRRRRDAELLGHVQAAALRAPRRVAGAADQGLEGVVAGAAMVFVNRHTGDVSIKSCATDAGPSPGPRRLPGTSRTGREGACLYSRSRSPGCQRRENPCRAGRLLVD